MVAAALAAAASMTGLAACGGDDSPKVASGAFITECKKATAKNAAIKAYADQACKCVQDQLKAAGLGDKRENDKAVTDKQDAVFKACGLKAQEQ